MDVMKATQCKPSTFEAALPEYSKWRSYRFPVISVVGHIFTHFYFHYFGILVLIYMSSAWWHVIFVSSFPYLLPCHHRVRAHLHIVSVISVVQLAY